MNQSIMNMEGMKNSNSVRYNDPFAQGRPQLQGINGNMRDRSLDLKISYGGLKAIDSIKLAQQQMSQGYNGNNNTPKPPQIGGGNYNPYKGNAMGSIKKGKDISPLAGYERDHNQQRIFNTYIDPGQQTVYVPNQSPQIHNKN